MERRMTKSKKSARQIEQTKQKAPFECAPARKADVVGQERFGFSVASKGNENDGQVEAKSGEGAVRQGAEGGGQWRDGTFERNDDGNRNERPATKDEDEGDCGER